jgi:DHA2 family multidrug resistance protein
MVTRQAAMIAYNNNFKLMLVLTLASMPLLFLLSAPRKGAGGAPIMVE